MDDVVELDYNPFATPVEYRTSSGGISHAKARAEVDQRRKNSDDHHPLRSAGLSTTFEDVGITRPHLTRILDGRSSTDIPLTENENELDSSTENEIEQLVIVHEIPSICEKLYIFRWIKLLPPKTALHNTSSEESTVLFSSSQEPDSSTLVENGKSQGSAFSSSTIRRVPASRLSFFPPPSKASALASPSFLPPVQSQPLNKPLYTRYATSPAPSLNTILTALPIAASTRDTIIARLSFDSASSSYSEREPFLDNHEGHELDDVQASSPRLSRENSQDYSNGDTPRRLKNGKYPYTERPHPRHHDSSTVTSTPKVRGEPLSHGRSLSEDYTGPPPPPSTRIRNVQLEPSPVMQMTNQS
ncbi:hypothetical protein BDP27DRAFT_1405811 [Rhodocollybia butyracea]|uniref:Uncharacterized protein n=1 Tax=Rhodocollybia butyracea TaxID=206335 RepID=A0A9P5PHE3_9AGAR|nr:hypothetical protein BDP27DRAFT_1405811 [Rhodocollybia butyracea]